MDNNLELKAKLFALYWGQNVMCFNDEGQYTPGVTYEVMGDLDEYNFLELKPISSISDEDAFQVSEIIGFQYSKNHVYNGKKFCIDVFQDKKPFPFNLHPLKSSEIIDFLRSKGYALPAFGLPVEELVSRGYIQLVA